MIIVEQAKSSDTVPFPGTNTRRYISDCGDVLETQGWTEVGI